MTKQKIKNKSSHSMDCCLLVQKAPDMIFVVDCDFKVKFANKMVAQQLKKKLKDLAGQSIDKLFPSTVAKYYKQHIKAVIKAAQSKYFESPSHFPGADVWLGTWLTPLRDENRKVYAVMCVSHDITKRKKTEKELEMSEQKLSELLKILPDPMDIVDKNLNVIWMSDKMKAIMKAKGVKNPIGKKCYAMYRDDKKQCENCPLKKPIKTGETKTSQTDCVLGGRAFEVTHTGMIYEGKKAVLEVFKDVTEERKAALERQQEKERFQILFESSRDAIMTLEPPAWMFTSGNPSTIKMFACKDEKDFISRGPWQYSPEKQPDGIPSGDKSKAMIVKAMKEGVNFFEWIHRRKNGEDFPATVLLARMAVGGKTFLQATVRDITRQKEAEIKLKYKIEQMEFMGRTSLKHHKKLLFLEKENRMLKQKLKNK